VDHLPTHRIKPYLAVVKKVKPPIPKWLKWEFWPFWFFYIPVYFKVACDSLRSGSFSYFTLVNPGMKTGGFTAYSKHDILRQLSPQHLPKTILFEQRPTPDEVLNRMTAEALSFPVILKPDEGERGWQVEKISDVTELRDYLAEAAPRLILQEYIDMKEEYGVMYFRFPSSPSGKISSLMKREFLSVTGDGQSSLLGLMLANERCLYHLPRMKKKFETQLEVVLPAGKKLVLEEIGNHNRGTTFLDANHLINARLIKTFDEASQPLKEWYFGRFDVRTPSFEEMEKGNFKVVEVNGVNSEPAHIYDPHQSMVKAYRDLLLHWNTIYRISRENRRRGFQPDKAGAVWQIVREHLREKKEHPNKR
jgi:hypothetical protein